MEHDPLKTAMIISRIFGLAPCVATPLRVSRAFSIYSYLLVAVTAILVMVNITLNLPFISGSPTTAYYVIGTSNLIIKAIILVIGGLTGPRRITHIIRFTKQMNQINLKLDGHSHTSSIGKSSDFLNAVPISYLILGIADFIIDWVLQGTGSLFSRTMDVVVYSTMVMAMLLSLQEAFLVQRLKSTLQILNDHLQNLTSYKIFNNASQLIDFIIVPRSAWEEHSPPPRHATPAVRSCGSTDTVEETKAKMMFNLRQMARFYLDICNLMREKIQADGPLIFLIIVCLPFHLEINIVRYYLERNFTKAMVNPWFYTILSTYRCLSFTGLIAFYAHQCNRTHDEMERTHSLLNYSKRQVRNEEVKNELDMFICIVTLNKVTNSPLGVWTINRSLVIKIIGCVITYLLVIVDYDPMFKQPIQ